MWTIFLRRTGALVITAWQSKTVRVFVLKQSKNLAQKQLKNYLMKRYQPTVEMPTHSPTATRIPITFE